MLTWKYTLPAFLVPFVFTLSSDGMGVLLQASAPVVAVTSLTAAIGVVALALAAGGWITGRANAAARQRRAGRAAPLYPAAASICSASECWR